MTEQLVTLEEWARRLYGEHAPHIDTLRRWARDAMIVPAPKKHGRSYFVATDAVYYKPNDPERPRRSRRLAERISDGAETS